jgi:hypothetical protein
VNKTAGWGWNCWWWNPAKEWVDDREWTTTLSPRVPG